MYTMGEEKYKYAVSGQITVSSSQSLRNNVKIGMRRVNRIANDYRAKGFFVRVDSYMNFGVDLEVVDKHTGILFEVAESTNYKNAWEFIKEEKLRRYITSLNAYDELPNVRKRLYVSFLDNVINEHVSQETLDWLFRSKIEVFVCGGQD